MKLITLIFLTLVVVSCSSNSPEDRLEAIAETENILRDMSSSPQLSQDEYKIAEEAYVQDLIEFYETFHRMKKLQNAWIKFIWFIPELESLI